MSTIDNINERYQQLLSLNGSNALTAISQKAFEVFSKAGVPTSRHEEWKYTRISSVFNKDYIISAGHSFSEQEMAPLRLPGHENATELVFVNGLYSFQLSVLRSKSVIVQSLRDAATNEFADIVSRNLGYSNKYLKDGIHALNMAFAREGLFIHVPKNKAVEHPVYVYNITDARTGNVLSQPRSLVHVAENARVQFVETFITLGASESFSNQVMELEVEKDAMVEYYKIQNDAPHTTHVSTTNFRQTGKSYVHAVTISLDGGIVRNNLNIALESAYSEANLYGLYFLRGQTHVDNHTVVDNIRPNCLSNELYKGVVDDKGTAVFNGKIFVEQDAQKTNAFQSNKNILLSDTASVNTKPQLEIFADDVKCSHGCTVGQLDEEGLFYLQSRGIDKKTARSLLVQAFAIDILEHIKPKEIRNYVDLLLSRRLEVNFV